MVRQRFLETIRVTHDMEHLHKPFSIFVVVLGYALSRSILPSAFNHDDIDVGLGTQKSPQNLISYERIALETREKIFIYKLYHLHEGYLTYTHVS